MLLSFATGSYILLILVDALYLLALINPVSKISILSTNSYGAKTKDLTSVVWRSSLVAFLLLVVIMIFGDFVLQRVFHVELYSLYVSGGVVLLWVGFTALRRGVFFEQQTRVAFADLAIVPLSCPMIAGPATIAACVALTAHRGVASPMVSLMLAIAVNAAFMMLSKSIARLLTRFNVMGAIIRITGLVVMTVGVQMIFNGLHAWANALADEAVALI